MRKVTDLTNLKLIFSIQMLKVCKHFSSFQFYNIVFNVINVTRGDIPKHGFLS